jgi:Ribbon-helix-helix protein, copG family
MKRITFAVPDDLNSLLENERRRRDVPTASVIREALATYLAGGEPAQRLPFIGLGRSGHHDTASRIDDLLAEGWDAAGDR